MTLVIAGGSSHARSTLTEVTAIASSPVGAEGTRPGGDVEEVGEVDTLIVEESREPPVAFHTCTAMQYVVLDLRAASE